MNAIHRERRNVVLPIGRDQQGMIIDDLYSLLRGKLCEPLIQLVDALEPLWAGIRSLRQSPRSPWRDGSDHHRDVMRFGFPHHGLNVGGSVGELPPWVHIVGAGEDMN